MNGNARVLDGEMGRRSFLAQAASAGAGLSLGAGLGGCAALGKRAIPDAVSPQRVAASGNRPNILWISSDQQRADTLGGLNNPLVRTPHLDRLAREGVVFTQAYVQCPVCTPSRASFLTGRYPRTCRTIGNGMDIPADEVLVTRLLADAGYDCGLSGKLHISHTYQCDERRIDDGYRVFDWSHDPFPWPGNQYTQWLESKGYRWEDIYKPPPGKHAFAGVPAELHQTTWCTDRAIGFICARRGQPWLMSVNVFAPHHPFDPSPEYFQRYNPDDMPLPAYRPGEWEHKPSYQRLDHEAAYNGHGPGFVTMSEQDHREVKAAYYAMIEQLDDQIGRLLKVLDDTGQADNTIVLFMSDHGEMLGDHGIYLKGPYLYDAITHVPLIMRWPGRFPAGLQSNALVEMVDLAPTLLEAVGQPVPARMQGRSLLPILRGEAAPDRHRDFVYMEYYNAMPFHAPNDPYITGIRTRTHKLSMVAGQAGELYGLGADPNEFENLWESPAHQEIKSELIRQCFDASMHACDPVPERQGPN